MRVVTGVVTGVLVTPPALVLAIISGGAGHGDYDFMKVLFPIPMLSTFGSSIGAAAIILATVQFPLYGVTVSLGWSRGNWWPMAATAFVHLIAAAACFGGAVPAFS